MHAWLNIEGYNYWITSGGRCTNPHKPSLSGSRQCSNPITIYLQIFVVQKFREIAENGYDMNVNFVIAIFLWLLLLRRTYKLAYRNILAYVMFNMVFIDFGGMQKA